MTYKVCWQTAQDGECHNEEHAVSKDEAYESFINLQEDFRDEDPFVCWVESPDGEVVQFYDSCERENDE